MKLRIALFLVALAICHPLRAQDGYFFSAQPPIGVRLDAVDKMIYFTNTGDKVVHEITVSHTDDKGNKTTKIIIDTIDPHKTVSISFISAVELLLDDSAITCTNYSKPLPVKLKF